MTRFPVGRCSSSNEGMKTPALLRFEKGIMVYPRWKLGRAFASNRAMLGGPFRAKVSPCAGTMASVKRSELSLEEPIQWRILDEIGLTASCQLVPFQRRLRRAGDPRDRRFPVVFRWYSGENRLTGANFLQRARLAPDVSNHDRRRAGWIKSILKLRCIP